MSGRDHLSGEQFQLFDPGPPEFEPGTWYHYSPSPDFDPGRQTPLHMGTPQVVMAERGKVKREIPGPPSSPYHGTTQLTAFPVRDSDTERYRLYDQMEGAFTGSMDVRRADRIHPRPEDPSVTTTRHLPPPEVPGQQQIFEPRMLDSVGRGPRGILRYGGR